MRVLVEVLNEVARSDLVVVWLLVVVVVSCRNTTCLQWLLRYQVFRLPL